MKNKFFFVIYLNNDNIKAILDGMRIIADPLQRNFSHITVKGPYRNVQKKRLNEDSKLIQGKEIKVLGAGNFFVENQNTVFLKCEEKKELFSIWKSKEEKTYKEFHPHITIYDGDDRSFAEKLYKTIYSHEINFSFIAKELEIYTSTDRAKLFNLKAEANYPFLSKISGFEITEDNIDNLNEKQKLTVVKRLCQTLEKINHIIESQDMEQIAHGIIMEA